MISYTQGNLLEAKVDALVNTVNTVGVMGKGIALMFKDRFPDNMSAYARACKTGNVRIGSMFVTQPDELLGPKWIVNFPTKQHWRSRSRMQWITEGLADLRRFMVDQKVSSIAIPPLGAGNGGLDWPRVKAEIERALSDLEHVNIIVYEPTSRYQNVSKREGVETLTPARALIAEMVRRYWVLGMECSLLEIQKLAWLLERAIDKEGLDDPLKLQFRAHKYGPYADRLRHLLEQLDGSYLKCNKRLNDCGPLDVIWFDDARYEQVALYLKTQARTYTSVLDKVTQLIDGFESPSGMELLATVGWLLDSGQIAPNPDDVQSGLAQWPSGRYWADRKSRLFDRERIELALARFRQHNILSIDMTATA